MFPYESQKMAAVSTINERCNDGKTHVPVLMISPTIALDKGDIVEVAIHADVLLLQIQ